MPIAQIVVALATVLITTVFNWLIFRRNFSLREIEVEAEAQYDTATAMTNYLEQVVTLQNMVQDLSRRLSEAENLLQNRLKTLEDYARRIEQLEGANAALEEHNLELTARVSRLQQELLSFTQA